MTVRRAHKRQSGAGSLPIRKALPPERTWNLAALFPDEVRWERAYKGLSPLLKTLEGLAGTLTSPARIRRVFDLEVALMRRLEKCWVYAHLRSDQDTADTGAQERLARITSLATEGQARLSWIRPELLRCPKAVLERWIKAEPLRPYEYTLRCLVRSKPHTLSRGEEALLAGAGEILRAPALTFSRLHDADLKFPRIRDVSGARVELTEGRYAGFLRSRDRGVRRRAFRALFDTYGRYRHTLAATLASAVKAHTFVARSRRYNGALEAALHADQIPVALYQGLLDAVDDALPQFHRYLALRARILQLRRPEAYDLHVPLVQVKEEKIPFEKACAWVLDAVLPLGAVARRVFERALRERWIDPLENRGKRSGAYSSGCYDSYPYILMNYQGTLNDVFTLAHELGHSLHSYLARRTQPPQTAGYSIFVAEIASTLLEALLQDYLMSVSRAPAWQARLRQHALDTFRGTVYRQAMFARFERDIHAMEASGRPLSADSLDECYWTLNRHHHGTRWCRDRRIAREWSRIPHFYYNFYVYKYATSYCAAQIMAVRILSGDHAQRKRTLDMLRAGGSDDPLVLVRKGGVDLTDPGAVRQAFDTFTAHTAALEQLLTGDRQTQRGLRPQPRGRMSEVRGQ